MAGPIGDKMAKTLIAAAKIKNHYEKTKETNGKLKCDCGGELVYSMASNLHIRAACKSCGISFME
jgi:hypothetical protein